MAHYDGYASICPNTADAEADVIRERQAARQRETARLKAAQLEDRIEQLEARIEALEQALQEASA